MPDGAETPADPASAPDPHPLLASLSARLASARARVLQADHDPRNAPELALTITRERSHRTEPYQTLGKVALKIPFGDRVRNAPRISQAHADWPGRIAAESEFLAKLKPDLVLLDVMMPGSLDGFGVCSHIKGDSALKKMKVVILSAKGQDNDKQQGKQSGADGYLTKPFSPRQLLDVVTRQLG